MGKTAELSYFISASIVAMFKAGAKVSDIAKEYNLPRQTVHYQINKFINTNDVKNLPRTGAKRKTTASEDRIILRKFRKDVQLKPRIAADE